MEFYYIQGELISVSDDTNLSQPMRRSLARFADFIFFSLEEEYMVVKNRWTGRTPVLNSLWHIMQYIRVLEQTLDIENIGVTTTGQAIQINVRGDVHARLILARMFPASFSVSDDMADF